MPYNPDELIEDLKEQQRLREAFLEGIRVGMNYEGTIADKEEFRHFVDSAWYDFIEEDDGLIEDEEVTLDL